VAALLASRSRGARPAVLIDNRAEQKKRRRKKRKPYGHTLLMRGKKKRDVAVRKELLQMK